MLLSELFNIPVPKVTDSASVLYGYGTYCMYYSETFTKNWYEGYIKKVERIHDQELYSNEIHAGDQHKFNVY